MMIDATFWVAISFLIFVFLLIYLKTPNKIKFILDENINKIKDQVDESEKLKEEAKNKLAEQERRLDSSKSEINRMLKEANELAEENVVKAKNVFHSQMDQKKKNTNEKIKQLKNQAIKDLKNASINIAFESIDKLMQNSQDKSQSDKLFHRSVEETKLALQKKSS